MLSVIGESPINTLEDSGLIDAVIARQILNHSSRDTQIVGWHWNTEIDYPLMPTFPEGELHLPTNTLKVSTSGSDAGMDLVQRGNRLYDRKTHSFIIGKDVTVQIVLLLPFDQLPEAARSYITVKAARTFQERMVGSESLWQFNKQDEMRAWASLLSAEAETQGYNVLTQSPSVVGILARDLRS